MVARKDRDWFYAAAIYNAVWGLANVAFPSFFFRLIGLAPPSYLPIWQAVGMFVLVYAPAYWWAARYPDRHAHLIVIALLGKLLGPVGFVWSLHSGTLAWSFGWTILTNDLIWWPPFILYLADIAPQHGGWLKLLQGE
jgi:hypothetical protein